MHLPRTCITHAPHESYLAQGVLGADNIPGHWEDLLDGDSLPLPHSAKTQQHTMENKGGSTKGPQKHWWVKTKKKRADVHSYELVGPIFVRRRREIQRCLWFDAALPFL